MAVQIGTATDYKDLLIKLRDFIMTPNSLGSVVPGGGNTGDGTVTGVAIVSVGPIATVSAANADNSFNDSASGFGSFIAGQWIKVSGFINDANNSYFKIASVTASKIVVSGGTLVTEVAGPSIFLRGSAADDAAVSETWTLTCTAGGATGTFSVVGSVSGAQTDATVGTAYDNSIVAFTINDGAIDFIIGDSFTFTVTKVMGIEHWTTKRWNANWDGSNGYEWIVFGPEAGSDKIYVGIRTYFSGTSEYYNWDLNGFTGYSSIGAWNNGQPGYIPNDTTCRRPQMLLWNSSIPYWFVANGRRFIVAAKVETVYESCYMGFLLPYGLPNQFSYPLVIGGTCPQNQTGVDLRYSSQITQHRVFVDPGGYSSGEGTLAILNGTTWLNFGQWSSEANPINSLNNTWPFVNTDYDYSSSYYPNDKWKKTQQNIDGSYPVFPIIPFQGSPVKNAFGELQGCFAVPGFGLATEDDVTVSGKTYKIFKNAFRSVSWAYWALLLE